MTGGGCQDRSSTGPNHRVTDALTTPAFIYTSCRSPQSSWPLHPSPFSPQDSAPRSAIHILNILLSCPVDKSIPPVRAHSQDLNAKTPRAAALLCGFVSLCENKYDSHGATGDHKGQFIHRLRIMANTSISRSHFQLLEFDSVNKSPLVSRIQVPTAIPAQRLQTLALVPIFPIPSIP